MDEGPQSHTPQTRGNKEMTPRDKELPENASESFDKLLNVCGDFNFYQWKSLAIKGLYVLFNPMHNLGAVFLAASPNFWCQVPYMEGQNLTTMQQSMNFTVPWIKGKEGSLEHSKCVYYTYKLPSDGNLSYPSINESSSFSLNPELDIRETEKCQAWIYDTTVFQSTVVSEWDLVCDRKWLMSTTQASYMLGIMTGAVVFSALSDKMGRRPPAVIASFIYVFCAILASYANTFSLFLVLRFFVAAAGQGMLLCNFTSMMEVVNKGKRHVMGSLFSCFICVGIFALTGLSYLIRDWRSLQLAISVPSVFLLLYYWILPESPRWLLSKGREKEGIEILKNIAKTNKRDFPPEEEVKLLIASITRESLNKPVKTRTEKIKSSLGSILTLVRTPNMRKRCLIMFYAWFVVSMTYYGITFNSANINASPYVTMAFIAGTYLLSAIFIIVSMFRLGRRSVLVITLTLGGIACLAIVFVPREMVALNLSLSITGFFMISNAFKVLFIYSSELVPTPVRNIAMGISSFFARIGSGAAPFIVDFLGDLYYVIPSTTFGALCFLGGILSFFLPETRNENLPDTVQEIEAMPR